jgi:hypothetical protein
MRSIWRYRNKLVAASMVFGLWSFSTTAATMSPEDAPTGFTPKRQAEPTGPGGGPELKGWLARLEPTGAG